MKFLITFFAFAVSTTSLLTYAGSLETSYPKNSKIKLVNGGRLTIDEAYVSEVSLEKYVVLKTSFSTSSKPRVENGQKTYSFSGSLGPTEYTVRFLDGNDEPVVSVPISVTNGGLLSSNTIQGFEGGIKVETAAGVAIDFKSGSASSQIVFLVKVDSAILEKGAVGLQIERNEDGKSYFSRIVGLPSK